MNEALVQAERVKILNRKPIMNRRYVLYWMQQSQRSEYNHALNYAILRANELNRPLVVFFGITDSFPEANERHYYFMLQGLRDVKRELASIGIQMVIQHASPELGVTRFSRNACLIVTDRGYLKIQRAWRQYAAKHIDCPLVQVESDVVVPIEVASPKAEYSAATLRRKIKRVLSHFLMPAKTIYPRKRSLHIEPKSFSIDDVDKALEQLDIDRSVQRVKSLVGGTHEAKRLLDDFIKRKLDKFPELRNDPTRDYLSHMSPYLHFGQISPLYIALRVSETKSTGADAYLEELVVRRELSMNYAFYNQHYDSFNGLPTWSKETLLKHKRDRRDYVYTLRQLENAKTHDPYWNAAQREMVLQGKMHGYMRMYWCKKIIEWTKKPEDAFRITLLLNNKYEIDGRDPNGFAGVAWSFGKHDRPWPERRVFGKVRHMNESGLKRKFDADGYVDRINSIEAVEQT